MDGSIQAAAYRALMEPDPAAKRERVQHLSDELGRGRLAIAHPDPVRPIPVPGRPARPVLVAPGKLERRGLGSARGRAALLHAVAHIEFNAINLALDAAYRFPENPPAYYEDWVSVAVDEARHFSLLADRLAELGWQYGDFPAHDGLWEAAVRTAHCGMTRMALVPRVLEARGLDVSPGMIARLRSAGDEPSAAIIEIILTEEVRHVEIGSRWFRDYCERSGVVAESTFLALLREHGTTIRPPLNEPSRRQAGFTDAELAALEALAEPV